MKVFTLSELYAMLDSSESGLSESEAGRRLIQNGPNLLPSLPARAAWKTFADQFSHFFAWLLWSAAAISFIAAYLDPASGMLPVAWAIVIVIVLNGGFGFYQQYRTEKSLESLRKILPMQVRVRRDGREIIIPGEAIVSGDIVLLKEGDKVPADLYIIQAFDLWANESTLSGESEPVSADSVGSGHTKTVLYSGTYIVKGEAAGLVFATGKESRYGEIALLTQEVRPEIGHLQKEIARISKIIAVISVLIAVSFVILAGAEGFDVWKTSLFSLGVLVAMIPEGLLPTVTLSLAFAAQRMASKGFLVNSLSVIENLGAVTVIATDKTGTITQNAMRVTAWTKDDMNRPSGLLLDGAILCNRAEIGFGDPIEQALVRFASEFNEISKRRMECPMVTEFPFDYHLKRMSTVHRYEGEFAVFCKGATEKVLELCGLALTGGKTIPMSDEIRRSLSEAHDAMAGSGHRVIAFAHRIAADIPSSRGEAESGLVFSGFIGMEDPLREDVADSVRVCHKAGIRVLMLTGDHPITAAAIGIKAGIISTETEVTNGEDMDRMPHSALKHLLRKNHVFARVSPEQKLRIVTLLKEMDETVAVTGDGVNDAPALKKADVGIAMGSGTDVAKQAAAAVLLDDHFKTIVKGIEEGRAVYDNIRRFITYMLASNLPEAVPYILYFWTGIPLALPVPLVLAIDLGTDILPGLALGAELPHEGLMHRGPRSRKEPILTLRVYARAFGFLGMMGAVISMGLFWLYLTSHGWQGERLGWNDPLYLQATTLTLAAIVFAQIGNGLSCRSERDSLWTIGWWNNPYYWGGVMVELGLLGGLIFVPSVAHLFGTAPFELSYWWAVALIPVVVVLAEEGRKGWMRHSHFIMRLRMVRLRKPKR